MVNTVIWHFWFFPTRWKTLYFFSKLHFVIQQQKCKNPIFLVRFFCIFNTHQRNGACFQRKKHVILEAKLNISCNTIKAKSRKIKLEKRTLFCIRKQLVLYSQKRGEFFYNARKQSFLDTEIACSIFHIFCIFAENYYLFISKMFSWYFPPKGL